ncbi:MAG: hypothetical protein ABID04_00455, partial [Patescibacteria group bacterium]
MKLKLKVRIAKLPWSRIFLILSLIPLGIITFLAYNHYQTSLSQKQSITSLEEKLKELDNLVSQDPYKTNDELKEEIDNIQKTFKDTVVSYEDLLKLKDTGKPDKKLDQTFAQVLTLLSERNYASASASLTNLQNEIKTEKDKITSSFKVPENLPEKNEAPDNGYSKQKVTVDGNTFVVAIIAADLANTKVIVDTASDSTCTNDCPVLPLADYVGRNNAFAGVNGSYFCPAS